MGVSLRWRRYHASAPTSRYSQSNALHSGIIRHAHFLGGSFSSLNIRGVAALLMAATVEVLPFMDSGGRRMLESMPERQRAGMFDCSSASRARIQT
jgi:hypothetical protein